MNRYDGYSFEVFKPILHDSTSISNNSIWALHEDADGDIWIGTFDGLNRYNPATEKFKRYMHDPNNPNSLSHKYARALYEDHSGTLWVGTNGGGLSKVDKKTGTFTRYVNEPDNPHCISNNVVLCMYEDQQGLLWVGTENGLNCFDRETETFICYRNSIRDRYSISHNTINALFEDSRGIFWIGTKNGLNKFNYLAKKFIRFLSDHRDPSTISNNDIRAIFEDKSGTLWIGTDDGLNRYDRENEFFVQYKHEPDDPNSLSKNGIRSMYEDRSGMIWVGTWASGINLFEQQRKKFEHYKNLPYTTNSLSYNFVLPLYEDKDNILWIGTYGGGLNRLDRKNKSFTHYRHSPWNPSSISHDRVRALCETRAGEFWIGTWGGGLNKFDKKTGTFTHYRHDPDDSTTLGADVIRTLFEDSRGTLWIGTDGGGVNTFDPATGIFTRYPHNPDDPHSISGNRIFDIKESKSGDIWIATFGGGLNKYEINEKTFTHYRHDPKNPNSLCHDHIMGLHEDSDGILWIGSDGKGFNKFDPVTGTFTLYNEEHGLPNSVVYAILEDDRGNLWMSHNMGLSKFNPKTETFKNYAPRDGVQSNEFNGLSCYKNPVTGEMFFGGVNGFNAFHPDSIKDNPYLPSIVITSFQLFNKTVPIGKMADGRSLLSKSITDTRHISLAYKDNILSFEFAALHYVSPEQNRYTYIMEGFEKEWNYVASNRRYVTYTNLPPGAYTFRVKGSNNDDVWNEGGSSVTITIIPPFWKTWWFYCLCAVIIIAVTVFAYRYRVNQLKKQKEEEEQRKAFANFSQVLEQGNAAVYRRDFESDTYEYIGEGIRDITGYGPDEITFAKWKEIIISFELFGSLKDMAFEEVFDLVRQGKLDRWTSDFQFRTKSGEVRWLRDMMTALRDESGQRNACLGIMFDITDRKKVEQRLAQTSNELKVRNEEMETDLNMAREIQMSFLAKHEKYFPPHLPKNKSALKFQHLYLPATSLAGDFFDIIPISDHEAGIFICDVMGHGARASLLTFYLRGLVEELTPIALDTASFMIRLNDGLNSIMERFYRGIFATAFYLVIDIKTGAVRFTNAGHPVPFILHRSKGTVEKMQANGIKPDPAIGIHEGYLYSEYESSVIGDDIVLLFTDGLFEVSDSEDELYGLKRLLESVKGKISLPPKRILPDILKEVHQFAETKDLPDDICMVSMHVKKLFRQV